MQNQSNGPHPLTIHFDTTGTQPQDTPNTIKEYFTPILLGLNGIQ